MKQNQLSRRQFLQRTAAAGALLAATSPQFLWAAEADLTSAVEDELAGRPQGPWRRLFLDAFVVEAQAGLNRVFHAAEKFSGNPVVKRDKLWEGVSAITGPYVYGTVFREGDKFRMWYEINNKKTHTGYAESRDGIVWTKPELGLINFDGSKANNLVTSAFDREATGGQCHNPSVIRRPNGSDPQKRYALYCFDNGSGHARVAFSPDGLRWKYAPETEKKALFTSSDVVNFFYDPYQQLYFTTWKTKNRRGRAAGVAWSKDGLNWTKPFDGPTFVADDLDPDATQIYGMPVFPYQGVYIGLPWIYNARYFKYGDYSPQRMYEAQADSPRTMEVQIAWSWDMINWTRPAVREQFILRGADGEWDDGMIVTARAPVVVGDKLYFYYGGCHGRHDDKRVQAAIGLATLRLDGFCSMRAGDSEGWLVSRREPAREPAVTINAQTAKSGYVTAEILDRKNRIIPGFSRQDCMAFKGDSVRHELKWKTTQFPAGKKLDDWKIRFWLKNADLYSYLPKGLDPNQPDRVRSHHLGS